MEPRLVTLEQLQFLQAALLFFGDALKQAAGEPVRARLPGRSDRYEVGLAGELHQLRREVGRLPEEPSRGTEVLHQVTRVAGA